jgi:prepilin-type processing-associated H-X9-DG protein
MSFRLWMVFYVFALVAAAMATFGPAGIFAASIVLGFWAWVFYARKAFTLGKVLLAVMAFLVLLALMLPAISSARQAAQRNVCVNNLKQIVLALLNYESANGSFPPPHVAGASGKPAHSWRVLILPYLGEQALFQGYSLNEPWDGPNNSKLAVRIPEVYRCPSRADDAASKRVETQYFAVVGPETGWPGGAGRNIRQFSDGTAKTVMVIEATGLGVHWMEPRDPTLQEAVELLTTKPRSGHQHVDDGFLTTTYYETSFRNVAFCDGHVVWMGQLKDAEVAKAMLTAAGGEPVTHDDWQQNYYVEPRATTVVKWGKVWGLSLFVLLALLPAVGLRRRTLAAKSIAHEQAVAPPSKVDVESAT